MAQTQLLSSSFGQQVTLEAKKQINLSKQTQCGSQVLLLFLLAACPEEYLLGLGCLGGVRGKGKAGNSWGKTALPSVLLKSPALAPDL